MKLSLVFAAFLFSGQVQAQAKKNAPWKEGSTVQCESPQGKQTRAEFVMTVINANHSTDEGSLGTSEMKIAGHVYEGGSVAHQFSNESFYGYWPASEGSRFEFFFNEGWPQVTYFIARFDLSKSNEVSDATAHFYPGKYRFDDLHCKLNLL